MGDTTLVGTAEPLTDSEFAKWVATINNHAPLWANNDDDRWEAVRFSARVAATFTAKRRDSRELHWLWNAVRVMSLLDSDGVDPRPESCDIVRNVASLQNARHEIAEYEKLNADLQAWIIDLKKRLVQKDAVIVKLEESRDHHRHCRGCALEGCPDCATCRAIDAAGRVLTGRFECEKCKARVLPPPEGMSLQGHAIYCTTCFRAEFVIRDTGCGEMTFILPDGRMAMWIMFAA
jgi:hypothetical protein